jgi:hypothetical protein
MSSARANASARNRRAGGNDVPQQMNGRPGQQQPQQMQQQMQQQMMPPKLSISDAIALITLRLGRVEQIIQEIPMDRQAGPDVDGDNVKIVDNEVFESVLKRLDVLDKGYKELVNKMNKPQPNTNTGSAISTEVTQAIEQLKLEMEQIKNSQQSVPNVQVNTTESNDNTETIEVLKAEITQVKEHLLNLQSFTMQTNQRLVEVLLNNVVNDDDGLVANDLTTNITNDETVNEQVFDTDTDNETNEGTNVVVTETLLM